MRQKNIGEQQILFTDEGLICVKNVFSLQITSLFCENHASATPSADHQIQPLLYCHHAPQKQLFIHAFISHFRHVVRFPLHLLSLISSIQRETYVLSHLNSVVQAFFIQSSRLYSITSFRYFSGFPFKIRSAYSSGTL